MILKLADDGGWFRTRWDPALVPKEVRSLDNTISMYNLVCVCAFCAQYFDPEFPDGVAFPIRVPARQSTRSKIRGSMSMESEQLIPYYDNRYPPMSVDVGDFLKRPRTVESRTRARRATYVAANIAERQKTMQDRILAYQSSYLNTM